jgi:hypothetical protein
MRHRQPIAVTVLLATLAPAAYAQEAVRTPLATASGGAAVASPSTNDAIGVNPGALALEARYDATGHFGVGAPGTEFAVTVVDSRTLPLAVGVAYRRSTRTGAVPTDLLPGWLPADEMSSRDRVRQHHVVLGLALPVAERAVSFGLGGDIAIESTESGARRIAGNASAGVGLNPKEGVSFGLAAHNLVPGWANDDRPLALVGGFELGLPSTGMLQFETEGRWTEDPLQTRLGIARAFGPVTARTGWSWTQAGARHAVSAGFSLDGKSGALDFGTEIPVTAPIDGPEGWYLRVGVRVRG